MSTGQNCLNTPCERSGKQMVSVNNIMSFRRKSLSGVVCFFDCDRPKAVSTSGSPPLELFPAYDWSLCSSGAFLVRGRCSVILLNEEPSDLAHMHKETEVKLCHLVLPGHFWSWGTFRNLMAFVFEGEHAFHWDFPSSADCKDSTCRAGDPGSVPESERSAGEGNGYPLQYSCLENPMGRGVLRAIVHGVTESRTQLSTHMCLSLQDPGNQISLYQKFTLRWGLLLFKSSGFPVSFCIKL